ncbi:hypothetical protein WS70_26620 [Burkholderia mayonis]|uniref:Uncharacterized protein n=1 Tax=Burkholderia mayonis TaxID=1385591 RepID=A0A1B4FNM4_9BURK|nr:hypothetical protein WS70_26620 [Burkholderia mayonis]KVE36980.1 hypothetical protein WS69_02140 [Burkholderia sp. BDU5]KVE40716.1 hypothetical protein WS70_16690 [Burkholderia mayonis]
MKMHCVSIFRAGDAWRVVAACGLRLAACGLRLAACGLRLAGGYVKRVAMSERNDAAPTHDDNEQRLAYASSS